MHKIVRSAHGGVFRARELPQSCREPSSSNDLRHLADARQPDNGAAIKSESEDEQYFGTTPCVVGLAL